MNQLDIAENPIDLQDLEIETFEVETLSEIGVDAAMSATPGLSVSVSTTSSTTSSSCG